MGFSKSWKHMVMTRALLGALEADKCTYFS